MTVGAVAGDSLVVELMSAAVEAVRKVADLVGPEQVWACSNGDLIRLLHECEHLKSATAAVEVGAVRTCDVREMAAGEGQPSTQVWLAKLLKLTPGEAKARVKAAGILATKAKDTAAAMRDGKLNADQGRAIAKALGKIADDTSEDEFAAAEDLLRREGRALHAKEIERAGQALKDIFDPDGTEPREDRAWRSRELTITDIGGGRYRIRGTLTSEGAATLRAALDPLAAPRPAEDGTPDPRSPAQRNHDALVEMAAGTLRSGDLPKSHGVRPHVHVTVAIQTLKGDAGYPHARTATGEALTIEAIRRIACDAGITPIITDTLGVPLSVGRESRAWSPAIWAALVARDIGCVFDGCTRPAAWCHGHHIEHWIDGGQTELGNGALFCQHHHHVVHHQHWQVRIGADGHPELIPPPWIDPLQRPQRNTHWKLLRDGLKNDEPDRGP